MAQRERKPKRATSDQKRATGRGRRGPAKTPTSKLKVHGSRLAKSRIENSKSQISNSKSEISNSDTIPFPCQLPERPSWCSYKRKNIWNNLISLYKEADYDVLAQVDCYVLARYCDLLAWYLQLRRDVAKEGETKSTFNKSGHEYISANPKAQLALKISTQLTKLETELYLNPASREGLELKRKPADGQAQPGSLADYFNKYKVS